MESLGGFPARMVLVDNATTHGVMFDDNPCTTDVEFGYLNAGVMPAWDVVCQAKPMHSFVRQAMADALESIQIDGRRVPARTMGYRDFTAHIALHLRVEHEHP
ncbi:hypothetical protein [Luteibacter sp. CQ10]|uniref:hypothetical protein n=1 Tax=Luteibacter sp. CQ10 TaxID=2805821 RepID=UPI0034A3039F